MVKTVELTSDEFYIRVSNKTLAYKVDDVRTVLPEDVSSLSIERDKDYVTLATYTPYGINDYRLLVRETRTKYVAEREKSTAKKTVVAGTWISDYAKSIGIRAAFASGPGRRRGNPKVHGETGPLAGASCQEPSRKARSIRKETDEQKIHKGSDRFQSE